MAENLTFSAMGGVWRRHIFKIIILIPRVKRNENLFYLTHQF